MIFDRLVVLPKSSCGYDVLFSTTKNSFFILDFIPGDKKNTKKIIDNKTVNIKYFCFKFKLLNL